MFVFSLTLLLANMTTFFFQETGHVTVPESGDYLLSFSANMVAVNSQAIWCALYKQSPGEEGWQANINLILLRRNTKIIIG